MNDQRKTKEQLLEGQERERERSLALQEVRFRQIVSLALASLGIVGFFFIFDNHHGLWLTLLTFGLAGLLIIIAGLILFIRAPDN